MIRQSVGRKAEKSDDTGWSCLVVWISTLAVSWNTLADKLWAHTFRPWLACPRTQVVLQLVAQVVLHLVAIDRLIISFPCFLDEKMSFVGDVFQHVTSTRNTVCFNNVLKFCQIQMYFIFEFRCESLSEIDFRTHGNSAFIQEKNFQSSRSAHSRHCFEIFRA